MAGPPNTNAPAARRLQSSQLYHTEGGQLFLIKLLQDHASRRMQLLEREVELQKDSFPPSLTILYQEIERLRQLVLPEDRARLLSLLRGTLVIRATVGKRLGQMNLELEQLRAYLSDLSKAADLITVMFGENNGNSARPEE